MEIEMTQTSQNNLGKEQMGELSFQFRNLLQVLVQGDRGRREDIWINRMELRIQK